MGFLRRFFSLRQKQKAKRADCRPDAAQSQQVARPEQGEAATGERNFDDDTAFRSKKPKKSRKDGDADAAVARLLRSSSANFNVVAQADYSDLPPLPSAHPINTVSSRSTSVLALTPTRTPSVQTKGSYRVIVHKRQQLSTTEFPNAYPPLTPRRPGIAHTSTPNLLATLSAPADGPITASTSTSALVDPRKVPITPRDANRLSRLRQDPSVASLLQMYDDHGRLAESAFANTPAPRRSRVRRSHRKSTFTELLGCEGAGEADLLWAEKCIARQVVLTSNSASNASTSSLSSTSTPPLDSPATSTFNELDLDRDVPTPGLVLARDPSESDVTEMGKGDGFSSLVVELSVATTAGPVDVDGRPAPYLGPYRYPQQTVEEEKEREREPEKGRERGREWQNKAVADDDATLKYEQQNQMLGSKVARKPSQRASQVFNFIAERRERRKSQELLQGSAISIPNLSEEPARLSIPGESLASKPTTTSSRSRSPSPLLSLPETQTNDCKFQPQHHSKLTPPVGDARDNDPAPAPPSPITLRPLCPAPRPKSRSKSSSCSRATGAEMLRTGSTASTSTVPLPGRPAKGSTGALVLLQAEREKEKERKRAEASQWRDAHPLPQTSTPHPSKFAKQKTAVKVNFEARERDRATLGEVTNATAGGGDGEFDHASFETRYDAFAASLDIRTQQMREKENAMRVASRRRGPPLDLGLTRASTTTLSHAPASKYTHRDGPQTPTRSQSLRGPEDPSPGMPSELSPEAAQLMADLRTRRALVRARSGRGKQAANVA